MSEHLRRRDLLPSLLALAFLLASAALGLLTLAPPPAQPLDAPASEFSAARALGIVEEIARAPHPVGSQEHERVRRILLDRLRAAGLSPELQRALSVRRWGRGRLLAAWIENIVARLPGTGGAPAILLVAHYDSAPTSPGASDDGAGVAALLEVARALGSGARLERDVILLLSDGEELGLLGARAFAREHPWAGEVGLVLNLEARGHRGPSIMFQTGIGSAPWIAGFARAAPHPVATSLADAVYRRLPNDTDFSVFRERGLPGFNFAFIDGPARYHTPLDSLSSLDPRSLQQHGANVLALSRSFGSRPLPEREPADAVYFNAIGPVLVYYPERWALPMALAGVLLLILLLVRRIRRKRLRVRSAAAGALLLLVAATLAPIALTAALAGLHDASPRPTLLDHAGGPVMAGGALLSMALCLTLLAWLRLRVSLADLYAGITVTWGILSLAAAVILPAASYALQWPFLGGLIALWLLRPPGEGPGRTAGTVLIGLVLAPGVVLLVPLIALLLTAMTVRAAAPIMVVVVLGTALLHPLLEMAARPCPRWLLGLPVALALMLLALPRLGIGFDASRPRADSIFYGLDYGLDAGSASAIWGSSDGEPDRWTRQFLGPEPLREIEERFLPHIQRAIWTAPAPAAGLPAPELQLLDEGMEDIERWLRLHVRSTRGASWLWLGVEEGQAHAPEVDGRPISVERGPPAPLEGILFAGVPEGGFELRLRAESSLPLSIRVTDRSRGLPALPDWPILPRSVAEMPARPDATMVSRSFRF